jgi:hypothetical protein
MKLPTANESQNETEKSITRIENDSLDYARRSIELAISSGLFETELKYKSRPNVIPFIDTYLKSIGYSTYIHIVPQTAEFYVISVFWGPISTKQPK